MNLIYSNSRYKYYVTEEGMIIRQSKNTSIEIGYIEDNMSLYKRLCEAI